ncbi:MAG TPA: hypothetical protein VF505_06765 [Thermoanaerobaculia bacterium]
MLILAILATSAFAEEVADSRKLSREALDAYKAKNYALFLEKSRAASDLRANHPTLLYNLASALALNGRGGEALDVLERVAAMGMIYEPAKDDDFASIRETPRFKHVVETFEQNARPTENATRRFSIVERGIISEGLAFDPKTKRFFVSSVRNGAIYVRDANGRVKTLVSDQPRGIFGMAVDASRRRLWASTSALPQSKTFREADRDHAAVLEIDLDSGKVIRTIAAPDNAKHLFGDVAVARDGTVYVSDSDSPTIYVIRRSSMEPLIAGPFASLQGLALSSDEQVLYAADYSKGVFAIDLKTRDSRLLPGPANVTLLGVDGLYRSGNGTLIGTQNGTNPQRVIRIRLAKGGLAIAGVDSLASNERDFDDITLGAVAGSEFCFNATGQWALFGDDGKPPDPAKLKPANVLCVDRR